MKEFNSSSIPLGLISLPNFNIFINEGDVTEVSSNGNFNFQEVDNSSKFVNDTFSINSTLHDGVPPEFLEMSPNSRNSVIAYIFLFVIAATGNFFVFFSVLQQLRRKKSRISVFIFHLSIADLLVTFGVIPLEVIWRITVQWYGGNILCKFCKFFSAFGLYLSSFVLICISLDRYFAIIHPLRVTDAWSRGRVMLMCAWIMATLCSLPQVKIIRHSPESLTTHDDLGKVKFSSLIVSQHFVAVAGACLLRNLTRLETNVWTPLPQPAKKKIQEIFDKCGNYSFI